MARLTEADIQQIFTFHDDPAKIPNYKNVRQAAMDFALVVIDNTPSCPDQSVAIRKIREAVMMANAAIALNGKY